MNTSVRMSVYYLLERYPKCRDDVNLCITKYFLERGITSVAPRLWGRADTVRREWRYWMNTKKAFPTSTAYIRKHAEQLHRDYYSQKQQCNEVFL